MKPTLPGDDPDLRGRMAGITRDRARYLWDFEYLAPLPLLLEPGTERPTAFQAVLGFFVGEIPGQERPSAAYLLGRRQGNELLGRNEALTMGLDAQRVFNAVSEFADYFKVLPRPLGADAIDDPAWFGWQRLGGMNPLAIRRVDAVPERFALPDAVSAQGPLYVCDYAVLDGLPTQPFEGTVKHSPACMGLFRAVDGKLAPVAVQLGQHPSAGTYTPADGRAWEMARAYFQSADLNVHEIGTHLCWTHFVLEGFIVATSRTLSDRHPVRVLLAPHLRFVVFNNFEGRELLIDPGGFATELLVGGVDGSRELLARTYRQWHLDTWHPVRELESRGFGPGDPLAHYPYRDDGLPVWEAIGEFVGRYVELYYPDDEAVKTDHEVQDWVSELASPAGAHVAGLDEGLDSREQLAGLLQRVIWASGPLHAAVNYPQYDCVGYTPNMPGAMYAPPLADAGMQPDVVLDQYLLKLALPPPMMTTVQLHTAWILTSYQHDRLGHYADGDFTDEAVAPAITDFQRRLAEVEEATASRMASRRFGYPFLLPSRIPNSASI